MPAVEPYEAGSSVKSAERVLRLFEIFYERQCPLTVSEISAILGSPQSSTSILLKSVLNQGYLVYDAGTRRYFPSLRLPLIADWISQARFPEARIYNAMMALNERFGHLVALAVRKELYYEVISVIPARTDLRYVMRHRELRPLAWTTIGQLFLSSYDDAYARRLLQRSNSLEPDRARVVDIPETLKAIGNWRRLGYAYSEGHAVPDVSVAAVLLPQPRIEENLVVAVVGPVSPVKPVVGELTGTLLDIKKELARSAPRDTEPSKRTQASAD